MNTLMMVHVWVHDDGWMQDYASNVPKILEQHGGKCVFQSTHVEQVEGGASCPHIVGVFEFPSLQNAQKFLESKEYRPYKMKRNLGARVNTYIAT